MIELIIYGMVCAVFGYIVALWKHYRLQNKFATLADGYTKTMELANQLLREQQIEIDKLKGARK